MAYGSIDGVNALLPNQLQVNAASDPNTTQVLSWCVQCDAMVDVALAAGGATSPATDTSIQAAVTLLVNAEVARLVVVKKTNAPEDDNTAFDRALQQMRDGKWAGAVASADSSVGPVSFTMNAPNDPSMYDARDPVFKRDQAHNF